jgi:hypothetical protein
VSIMGPWSRENQKINFPIVLEVLNILYLIGIRTRILCLKSTVFVSRDQRPLVSRLPLSKTKILRIRAQVTWALAVDAVHRLNT